MKLLWIGRMAETGVGGDYIFDRKTIAACIRLGHTIETLEPPPVGRIAELLGLVSGRLPYYRSRYYSKVMRRRIERAAAECDAVVCSWEPLDAFALDLPKPTVVIPHNITSEALRAIYPRSRLVALLASSVRRYERRAYSTRRIDAMAALSRRDLAYIESLEAAPAVAWTPPGMPPAQALARDATLRVELILAGSYGWKPKRRDVLRFIADVTAEGASWPITTLDPLPTEAYASTARVHDADAASYDWPSYIRFGIIPDRFTAGHKLKTLHYIANNCVVLSYSDVLFDFDDIGDADLFIRRVRSASDIRRAIEELARLPAAELRARFGAFKARCEERFTWARVADSVIAAARHAVEAHVKRGR